MPCDSVSEWTACRNGQTYTGTLTVPAAVSSIGKNAFAYTDLTELDLSEATALETIGERAFFSSSKLTGTLKVGAAVTSIGDYAFSGTNLTELDLSEATALNNIGVNAFADTNLVQYRPCAIPTPSLCNIEACAHGACAL